MDKQHGKRVEGPKAKIHLDSLRAQLKDESNSKTPGHDGKHGYWLKKITFPHDKLAMEINRCLEKTNIHE